MKNHWLETIDYIIPALKLHLRMRRSTYRQLMSMDDDCERHQKLKIMWQQLKEKQETA